MLHQSRIRNCDLNGQEREREEREKEEWDKHEFGDEKCSFLTASLNAYVVG